MHDKSFKLHSMRKIVCAGGFLMDGNKFLFGKRNKKKKWAPGVWDIVGGKSLKNEHPLYTLQRETFEEIAVNVLNAELITTLELNDNQKNIFTYHIYMITAFTGKPVNCSNEHSKIKWFTPEELNTKSLALPEYLTLIDDWIKHKSY